MGARPLEFRPCSFPPDQIRAKLSEPMPLEVGSTTGRAAAAATAASMALPPFFSMSTPAWAARWWEVAHMPFMAYFTKRREA